MKWIKSEEQLALIPSREDIEKAIASIQKRINEGGADDFVDQVEDEAIVFARAFLTGEEIRLFDEGEKAGVCDVMEENMNVYGMVAEQLASWFDRDLRKLL